jgi:hypothetical protein
MAKKSLIISNHSKKKCIRHIITYSKFLGVSFKTFLSLTSFIGVRNPSYFKTKLIILWISERNITSCLDQFFWNLITN